MNGAAFASPVIKLRTSNELRRQHSHLEIQRDKRAEGVVACGRLCRHSILDDGQCRWHEARLSALPPTAERGSADVWRIVEHTSGRITGGVTVGVQAK
jgi:hypothetical protein